MAYFKYRAFDANGKNSTGVVEAANAAAAQDVVASLGLIPTHVAETRGMESGGASSLSKHLFQRVKAPEIILFTKQLRTMLNAGIPVLQSLAVLEDQTENVHIKRAIADIGEDVKRGSTLSRAFARHPQIFSRLYCNMLRAGEISGTLTDVLNRLIYIISHEQKIRQDIKSALTYPIIVIVALVIAFFVLILVVFPQFIPLFAKAHAVLPLPTRVCLEINRLLTRYWMPTFGGIGAFIFLLTSYLHTERGRLQRDGLLLHLPILGPVFRKAAMARFASIFAILQSSGITVLDSMDILAGTIGNAFVARDFKNLREKLEEGRGLSGPLRGTPSFTPMMVSMIGIGEETGNMEEMLSEAARHYDDEVEYAVGRMSELIGPILVAGLAAVVGFFALAVFLPLVDLMQNAMNAAH